MSPFDFVFEDEIDDTTTTTTNTTSQEFVCAKSK